MFTKKAEPQMAKPLSSNSTFSVLGSDTVITGDIQASVDLHIDGAVTGDITCSSLVQGVDSSITGAIKAESVRISGKIKGTVAAQSIVVLASARIEGDMAYDSLTVEQGARIEGRLVPNGGDLPPAITAAANSDEPVTVAESVQ